MMKKITFTMLLFLPLLVLAQISDSTTIKKRVEQELKNRESSVSLSEGIKQQIISSYMEAYQTTGNRNFSNLFKIAVSRAVKDTTMYYPIFKNEVDSLVKEQAKIDLEGYRQEFNLTDDLVKKIENSVTKQTLKLQMCQYYYPENIAQRLKACEVIKNRYKYVILTILTENGATTYYSVNCRAIKYRKELSLNKSQLRKIVLAAIGFTDKKKANPTLNLSKLEHETVKTVLNESQYEVYLTLLAKERIVTEVQKRWNEIKKYGIDAEVDSIQACNQINSFYIERERIRLRYSIVPNSDEIVETQLSALYESTPLILKKLYAIRKREKKNAQQDNNSLIW